MAISKIQLPGASSATDVHDARISSIDTTVTQNSSNPVTSGAVYTAIQGGGGGGGGITGTGVTAIVALTESEYEALSSKSSTTLYIVTPDQIPYGGNYIKISWGRSGSAVNIGNDGGSILEIGENIDTSTIVENPPVIIKPDDSIMDFSTPFNLTPHYQQNTLSFNNGSTYFDLLLNNETWTSYFD